MKTNKKKAENFFTHANVKKCVLLSLSPSLLPLLTSRPSYSKSRRGGPVADQAARKAAVAAAGAGGEKVKVVKGHAGTSKKRGAKGAGARR
jgi:hypothetical protein